MVCVRYYGNEYSEQFSPNYLPFVSARKLGHTKDNENDINLYDFITVRKEVPLMELWPMTDEEIRYVITVI